VATFVINGNCNHCSLDINLNSLFPATNNVYITFSLFARVTAVFDFIYLDSANKLMRWCIVCLLPEMTAA
jgi:hypothetical protein